MKKQCTHNNPQKTIVYEDGKPKTIEICGTCYEQAQFKRAAELKAMKFCSCGEQLHMTIISEGTKIFLKEICNPCYTREYLRKKKEEDENFISLFD